MKKSHFLALDATYGNNELVFSDRNIARYEILKFAISKLKSGKIPVLYSSPIGGAQEIIKFFNLNTNNIPIFVDEKIGEISSFFNRNDCNLNFHPLSEFEKSGIVIVSRSLKKFPQNLSKREISTGIITGQSSKFPFSKFDFTSSLSTHASYDELIKVIFELDPQKIITRYSYDQMFAENLRNEYRLDAISTQELSQTKISTGDLIKKGENDLLRQMLLNKFF